MYIVDIILTVISFGLSIIVLGLVIGFSPLLYSIMLGFRGISYQRSRLLGWWLIAGIATGIIFMFALGGSIATLLAHLLNSVRHGGNLHYPGFIIAGGISIAASVRYRIRRTDRQKYTTVTKKQPNRAALIFAVGFSRTVTSISGLAAVVAVSTVISLHGVEWLVSYFVVGPLVLAAATLPYFFLLAGGRSDAQPPRATRRRFELTVAKRNHLSRVVSSVIGAAGCLFVAYGLGGLFIW